MMRSRRPPGHTIDTPSGRDLRRKRAFAVPPGEPRPSPGPWPAVQSRAASRVLALRNVDDVVRSIAKPIRQGRERRRVPARSAAFSSAGPTRSRVRTPGRGVKQLDLLGHHQRPELRGEALGEIGVGKHRRPVCATGHIVFEFPEVDNLVDRSGVALKVADKVLVVTALFQGWKAELLVEPDGLGHLSDVEGVGSELVECHERTEYTFRRTLTTKRSHGTTRPAGRLSAVG